LEKLKAQLKIDEGLRTKPYFCPAGFLTIGWGRNLEANPLTPQERAVGHKYGWGSKQFVEHLFENDIAKVVAQMEKEIPWSKELDPARQIGLANMIFQMGVDGVLKFERSMAALEVGDYDRAETYLKQSKWYRQTPQRAERVITQLTRGTFPENT
jgi:lysozyme